MSLSQFYANPNEPGFTVPNVSTVTAEIENRISNRISLRKQFDRLQQHLDGVQEMQALNDFEQQAVNVLTSNKATEAFDINQEPEAIRERQAAINGGSNCCWREDWLSRVWN
ncbi:MAG: hypothetical protein R3C11_04945 [Planctomycetaceae bacterium]